MKYWNHKGKYQDAYNKMAYELMPSDGPAESVAGEAIRAISKIYYDCYNNGFINNTSGAYNYLDHLMMRRQIPNLSEPLRNIQEYVNSDLCRRGSAIDELDENMDQMVDAVIEWIKNNPHTMAEPNPDDMLDMTDPDIYDDEMEEDEDDYFL